VREKIRRYNLPYIFLKLLPAARELFPDGRHWKSLADIAGIWQKKEFSIGLLQRVRNTIFDMNGS